ncbi:MAG: SpoIIE family protein phosphatase [Acidobacteria bacterium]|nr:SpoIIE family protein phosphatase [Acidobacteriota bacterium]
MLREWLPFRLSFASRAAPAGLPSRPPAALRPRQSIPQLLLRTFPGRVLIIAAVARVAVALLQSAGAAPPGVQAVGTAASLALVGSLGYFAARILLLVKQRLLWRVRRKLVLSYVLIGFIPALLIVAFFLLAGLLMFFNVSSYLFKTGFDDLVDAAQVIAQTTTADIERGGGATGAREVLARRQNNGAQRYPGLSLALVRVRPSGDTTAADSSSSDDVDSPSLPAPPIVVGPWRHLEPPTRVPAWLAAQRRFAGTLAYVPADDPTDTELVIRAVAFPGSERPSYAVIVDLPIDDTVAGRLREATGIKLDKISVTRIGGETVRPIQGRMRRAASRWVRSEVGDTGWKALFQRWVAFLDYTEWDTGKSSSVSVSIRVGLGEIYERISSAQTRLGNVSLGDLFLLVLVVIAGLFLIIEFVALVMGFALAKSITGSVHELFMGTERVRQGDFSHRINVRTRDQLGELAESFNSMTGSIEDLLQEAAEKKRLEEELRIARQIQMSLLPRGALTMRGIAVTALCVPAREVGGDYYDFFQLADDRLGILIADVSGKGTSAAFYMAELKGLVLSLSQIYQSPKRLLIEVNRIISDNLDSRSFITMTYAVLDLGRRTLVYARAGHTPLIYLPAARPGAPCAEVLAPDGLVLGLRLEGIEAKFEQLLEECSLPISTGDVFVFFTDGISEAMNEQSDLFGESRLSRLIEEHRHLSSEELRERILREVKAFVGAADQHDDMTMILLKIEDLEAIAPVEAEAMAAVGIGR